MDVVCRAHVQVLEGTGVALGLSDSELFCPLFLVLIVVPRLSCFLCVSLLRRCLLKVGDKGTGDAVSVNKVICAVLGSTVGHPSAYSKDAALVLRGTQLLSSSSSVYSVSPHGTQTPLLHFSSREVKGAASL